MKILHIADVNIGKNLGANGILTVLNSLSQAQKNAGADVIIGGLAKEKDKIAPLSNLKVIPDKKVFQSIIMEFNPDVVIFHSLYKLPYLGFSKYLRKKNIPYLIEFHGAATQENARKSRYKKSIANLLGFNKFLISAKGFIYLNQAEEIKSVVRNKNKEFLIIPNGVNPNKTNKHYTKKKKCELVFLGRINWIHKGLDYLLEALDILQKDGWENRIHVSFLGPMHVPGTFEEQIGKLQNIATYKGPIFGAKKEDELEKSDIYILTSRYEGMPMTILEALNHGCPCIVTPQTNMGDFITATNSGWVVELSAEKIAQGIKEAVREFEAHPDNWITNSYNAVKEYDWDNIAVESLENIKKIISH